jgi:hypothetical protein
MKNEGPRLRHYPDVTLQPSLRLDALHPSRLLRIIPVEVVRAFDSGDGTGDAPVGRDGLAAWGETQDRGSRTGAGAIDSLAVAAHPRLSGPWRVDRNVDGGRSQAG